MGKGLSPEQIVRRVREAAEPVVASFGLTLWGIEVVAGGRTVVRVYVDAPAGSADDGSGEDGVLEGVSVDQCAEISRMVGLALEVDEVFSDAWVLEVSSPGLGRELTRPKHFSAYIGRDVIIRLIRPLNGQKEFRGTLGNCSDGKIRCETGGGLLEFDRSAVAKVCADDLDF